MTQRRDEEWKRRLEKSNAQLERMLEESRHRLEARALWERWQKPVLITALFAVMLISLFSLPLFSPGGTTGFFTKKVVRNETVLIGKTITGSGTIALDLPAVQALSLNARVLYDAPFTVWVDTPGKSYLLYKHASANANASGTQALQRPLLIRNACGEACTFAGTPLQLRVEGVDEVVHIESVQYRFIGVNTPPRQVFSLPDHNLTVGDTVRVDLSRFFGDPDGDVLFYDVSGSPGLLLSVKGSELFVTAVRNGTYDAFVYVSDLHHLIVSEVFTVHVEGPSASVGQARDSGGVRGGVQGTKSGVRERQDQQGITIRSAQGAGLGKKRQVLKTVKARAEACPSCIVTIASAVKETNATVRFLAPDGRVVSSPQRNARYALEVLPEKMPVARIVFADARFEENLTIGLDDVSSEWLGRPFLQSYAIDPTRVNFSLANVTAVAKGRRLFKCKEYDFAGKVCTGRWEAVMRLTPGEAYTFPLTPQDPAYGEGDAESEPDYAFAYSTAALGDNGVVTSNVTSRDAAYANILESGTQSGSYLQVNWTNTFNGLVGIENVTSVWSYNKTTSLTTIDLNFTWWNGSAWQQMCVASNIATSYTTYACDLSSVVDTVSELNDVKVRVYVKNNGALNNGALFDYAGLNITLNQSCGTITQDTTLIGNVSVNGSTCFTIGAGSITLDCAGYWIVGNDTASTSGIDINGQDNVTIKNCNIKDFATGISSGAYANDNIIENIYTESNTYGIDFANSARNAVTGLSSFNDTYGVHLTGGSSDENNFTDIDIVASGTYGVWLEGGDKNRFVNLSMNYTGTSYAVYVSSTSANDTLFDCQDSTILGADTAGTRGFYVAFGGVSTVQNCIVKDFERGVVPSQDSLLVNLTATSNTHGIYVDSENNIAMQSINASGNTNHGFYLYNANGLNLSGIVASDNSQDGLYVRKVTDSVFDDITADRNALYGIELVSFTTGSNRNNFTNVRIDGGAVGDVGIRLQTGGNANNSFVNFNITINGANHYGILVNNDASDNNYFDCAGGFIDGDDSSGSNGVRVSSADGITIGNCTITDFADGIYLSTSATGASIRGNNVSSSTGYGMNIADIGSSGGVLENNFFCNSSGAYDAYDADSNTWTNNSCDAGSPGSICYWTCAGVRNNNAPVVASLSLSPAIANASQDLNCTFVITDEDVGDTLFANYTWFVDGVKNVSGQVSVTNGTASSVILGAGNTSIGEQWWCNVTGYDGTEYSSENQSSTTVIVAETVAPSISFVSPTPTGGTQASTAVYVNVSSSDASDHSVLVDWNSTLALWMQFTSGADVTEESSYEQACTDYGSSWSPMGQRGGKRVFDGSARLDCSNASQYRVGEEGSLLAWVEWNPTATDDVVVSNGQNGTGGWYVIARTNGDLDVSFSNASAEWVSSGQAGFFSAGQPVFMGIVFNSSEVQFYKNGVFLGSEQIGIDWSVAADTEPLVLGAYRSDTSKGLNGSLDEVQLYNRVLAPEEINASWNASAYPYRHNFTGLVNGTYTFKAYAIDASGNTNETEQRSVTVHSGPQPVFDSVNITPASPYANDSLSCEFNVSQSDGANITVLVRWWRDRSAANWTIFSRSRESWLMNASVQGTLATSRLGIDRRWTAPGESWKCEVTADNGFVNVSQNSSAVTISSLTASIVDKTPSSADVNESVLFAADFLGQNNETLGRKLFFQNFTHEAHDALFWSSSHTKTRDGFVIGDLTSGVRNLIAYNASGSNRWNASNYIGGLERGDFDRDGVDDFAYTTVVDQFKVVNGSGSQVELLSFRGILSAVLADLDGGTYRDDYASLRSTGRAGAATTNGSSWTKMFDVSASLGTPNEVKAWDISDQWPGDELVSATANYLLVMNASGDVLWNVSNEFRAVAIVDIDNDGRRSDIVAHDVTAGLLRAFDKDGVSLWNVSVGVGWEMGAGDFDGDGYVDDVFAQNGTSKLVAVDESGDVLWSLSKSGSGYVASVEVFDVDLDSVDEVLAAGGDNTAWLIDDGSFVMNASFSYPLASDVNTLDAKRSLDVEDWDGDGVAEFLAVSSGTGVSEAGVFGVVDFCRVDFSNGTSVNLTWNASAQQWERNFSFSSSGVVTYNITCRKGGYGVVSEQGSLFVGTNQPPSVESLALTPAVPENASDLNCTFTIVDDGGGGGLWANYTWVRDGALYSSGQVSVTNGTAYSLILGAGNTTYGEQWYCNVTGFDGTNYSSENQSNTVTVTDTAPTVASVSLLPAKAYHTQDLNCSFIVTDPNTGDSLSANVSWFKDGTLFSSGVYAVLNNTRKDVALPAANTGAGEDWLCQVTPSDGYATGSSLNSSASHIWQNISGCGTIYNDSMLSTDLSSPGASCITFGADSIALDCAGHTIDSDDSPLTRGVNASGKVNISVAHCVISDFTSGVWLDGTNQSVVENVTVVSNTRGVDVLGGAKSNVFTTITVINSSKASILFRDGASANNFSQIVVQGDADTEYGIRFGSGGGVSNRFEGVNISWALANPAAYYGVFFNDAQGSATNVIDCQGGVVSTPSSANAIGGFYLNDASSTSIVNCTVVNFTYGVYAGAGSGTQVSSLTVNASDVGVYLSGSSQSVISDVSVNDADLYGVWLEGASSNNLSSLTVQGGSVTDAGVYVSGASASTSNKVTGLSVSVSGASHHGVYVDGELHDNNVFNCQGGTIDGSDTGGTYGVYLSSADGTTVGNCSITDFSRGVYAASSSGNTFTNVNVSSSANGYYLSSVTSSAISSFALSSLSGNGVFFASSSSNNVTDFSISLTGAYAAVYVSDETSDTNKIDCGGGVLSGNDDASSFGVRVSSADDVTLRNCTVKDFGKGVFFEGTSSGSVVEENNVSSSVQEGVNVSVSSVTSSTFSNNYFCGSGGAYDAYDADSNTWTNNSCDSRAGWAWCSYLCDGTPVANNVPNVTSVTLLPASPMTHEDLNCSFIIEDADPNDVVLANVSWFRDGAYFSSSEVQVTNGTEESVTLSYTNTALGESWLCQVTPRDQTDVGSAVNSTSRTIEQGCDTITSDVTMTRNFTFNNTCITFGADNIVLDCAGYAIIGEDVGYGVTTNGYDNVSVKNCVVSNFSTGVFVTSSENSTFQNLTLTSHASVALQSASSNKNTYSLIDVNMTGASLAKGVSFSSSGQNTVSNLDIVGSSSEYALEIVSLSSNNNFSEVNVTVDAKGIKVGTSGNPSSNNQFVNTSVSVGLTTSSGVELDGGSNNRFDCGGRTLTGASAFGDGVSIYRASKTTVSNCIIRGWDEGVIVTGFSSSLTGVLVENVSIQNVNRAGLDLSLVKESRFVNVSIEQFGQTFSTSGVLLQDGTSSNNFTKVTIAGSGSSGVDIEEGTINTQNRFVNISIFVNGSVVGFDSGDQNEQTYIDCGGGVVQGNDSAGSVAFNLSEADGYTIKNCTILDFDVGINVSGTSTGHTIENNNVSSSLTSAIRFATSADSGSSMASNVFCGSGGAYDVFDGDSNTWSGDWCDNSSPAFLCTYFCNGSLTNQAPQVVYVNVTPLAPYTTDDLNCTVNVTDDGLGSGLWINYTWYKDGVANVSGSVSTTSGEENVFTLGAGNTTKGEVWWCNVTGYDGELYSLEKKSNNVTIQNTLPDVPTLLYPSNGNTSIFERNVNLNWTSSDADGDTLSYNLSINQSVCPSYQYSNLSESNYTTEELCVDRVYNWTVQACDDEGCSAWASIFNFTIQSSVIITLTNAETNFGSMNVLESNDTTDDNPLPFGVRNDGNVVADVSLRASDGLWDAVGLNTSYFQFAAGNSSEAGSFVWGSSATSWTNVSNESVLVLKNLSYVDAGDEGEVEFRVEVPLNEPGGAKQSQLFIIAEYPVS